jgi:cobaltochelatase CobS
MKVNYKGKEKEIDSAMVCAVDSLLETQGLPKINTLFEMTRKAEEEAAKAKKETSDINDKIKEVSKKYSAISAKGSSGAGKKVEAKLDAEGNVIYPNGSFKMVKAHSVFPIDSKDKALFDFDVPLWTWDSPHPHVPPVDKDYVFRTEYLKQYLWGLTRNKKTWIAGETGTGKSTLVAQVAALLNYPMMRINFDSEITRSDLIGRDTLTHEIVDRVDPKGNTYKDSMTVSKFVDGVLPSTMVKPYILLCDEVDFVKPEVSYVMQRALEDEGLLVSEDGDRVIIPNDMFRMVATANTRGQGDEDGLYQGARNQSMAFLDRFTCWIDVEHLDPKQEEKLLKARVPFLDDKHAKMILKYIQEHRRAFQDQQIMQPLSPRGVTTLAEAVVDFTSQYPEGKEREAIRLAVKTVLTNKANRQDSAVISGIVNNVFP